MSLVDVLKCITGIYFGLLLLRWTLVVIKETTDLVIFILEVSFWQAGQKAWQSFGTRQNNGRRILLPSRV